MGKAERKVNKRAGVLICGAYGMSNTGDEAILEAMLAEMRSIDPDMPITVLSRTPEQTSARHGVKALHMFDIFSILSVMRRSKLYINGGGSLIQDATSSRSIWYYLYTLMAAKHRGCRVLMYGCGIGPVGRKLNRRLTKFFINRYVDAITLREAHSLAELQSMGVTKPHVEVASDPALSLSAAPEGEVDELMRDCGLDPRGRYICFCLRDWTGYKEKARHFAAAADYAAEVYGLSPVFLLVNRRKDGQPTSQAIAALRTRCVVVDRAMSTAQTVGFISRMSAVVAMRLHALIFAAGQSVPLAGVSYDPKVAAFLDYIGMENYVDFPDVDPEGLCALIDRAVATDRALLRANTERIKAIESRNTEAARELLK